MADRDGLFAGLVDDPELREQVGNTVPPQAPLTIDGVSRHSRRPVDVHQALALSARGMRRFLLSFDLCCELPEALFAELVEIEREILDDPDSSDCWEGELFVYGRRQGHEDTRVVALVLARRVLEDD